MFLLRDFPGRERLWGGDAGFDSKDGIATISTIRARQDRKSFESKLSVKPRHETDMMDNHYKTSMQVK
jgi:hypothetical protein